MNSSFLVSKKALPAIVGHAPLAREMVAAGWLVPVVNLPNKNRVLFLMRDIAKAIARLENGELPKP
jgi:hypothetical protein